jgi:outer membrane protein assembly factor BamA
VRQSRQAASARVLCVLCALLPTSLSAQQDIIVAIQIHGNTITPDEEIVATSGLSVAMAFSDALLEDARRRLQATNRFERVDVLKRYGSVTDPTQILVVIRVDEGPVRIEIPGLPDASVGAPKGTRGPPRAIRRGKLNLMFVPVLDAEDGYGLTYGVKVAVAGHTNATTRVIFPATWGGDKRAGVEFQKEFSSRLAPRVRAGTFIQRRTHPYFHSNADRRRIWARGEWPIARSLHAGTTLAWQSTSLLGRHDRARSAGVDLTLDTRVDPLFPRNAILATTAIERLQFPGMPILRTEHEVNGYIGIYGGTVLVLRAIREDMSDSAPPYFKSILGGSENLRGFRAGTAVGDTMVAGSVEVRIPLTSPVRLAKFGTSIFMDAGTAYDKGERFRDQTLKRGVGAGLWATAALFRISFMVAHGIGADTKVHFGAGLTF